MTSEMAKIQMDSEDEYYKAARRKQQKTMHHMRQYPTFSKERETRQENQLTNEDN